MDTQERIDTLIEAQDLLGEVIALIKRAVDGTDLESYARGYLVAHLIMARTTEHEYLGRQANLDELLAAFEDGDDDA